MTSIHLRASEVVCFLCFLVQATVYSPCMPCGFLPLLNQLLAYLSKKKKKRKYLDLSQSMCALLTHLQVKHNKCPL